MSKQINNWVPGKVLELIAKRSREAEAQLRKAGYFAKLNSRGIVDVNRLEMTCGVDKHMIALYKKTKKITAEFYAGNTTFEEMYSEMLDVAIKHLNNPTDIEHLNHGIQVSILGQSAIRARI